MEKSIKHVGPFHMIDTEVGTYAVRYTGRDDMYSDTLSLNSTSWDADPTSIAGVKVVPWGADNNLPIFIRDLLEKNNLGPGILERKTGLLYGQGPLLYRMRIEGGECIQDWIEDAEIQSWLDTWEYRQFIRNAFVEYNHMRGLFVKYHSGKAVRIGKPWITRLECLHSADCRLVWPANDRCYIEEVTHILTGHFESYKSKEYRMFPVFDKWRPAAAETAIKYHSMRSFGRNMYALSSFYGSVPWMIDANSLPQIIDYLNNNMIAAAYMVHQPDEYWSRKESVVRDTFPEYTDEQVYARIDQLKDEVTKKIADVMAGQKNAGKFFSCVDFVDDQGNAQSWKIEPIEMNIDKYIKALVDISRVADSSTTSGFGLNPALANIIIDGKGDSGSQMLYAIKLFYGADTQIPEEIALEAINDAIRVNFPHKKGVFMGIYRKVINKEDNVAAANRVTNQT